MNILVVDDKENVLDLLTRILLEQGHSVDTACNGLDASEKAQKNFYELFIVDHLMPIMDGIQLTKNLRSAENTSESPIVLMTTQGKNSLQGFKDSGLFTAIIDKPINEEALVLLINSFISKNTRQLSL